MTTDTHGIYRLHPGRFFLAGILFTALLVFGMKAKGASDLIVQFIDLPTILFVYFAPLPLLWVAFPLETTLNIFSFLFTGRSQSEGIVFLAKNFFRLWTLAAFCTGSFGCMLGLMEVMTVLDQPEMIGPGIAVAFISLMHALFLTLCLIFPLQKYCERNLQNLQNRSDSSLVSYQSQFAGKFRYWRMAIGLIFFSAIIVLGMSVKGAGDLITQTVNLASMLIFTAGITSAAIMTGGKRVPSLFKMIFFKDYSVVENKAATRKLEAVEFCMGGVGLLGAVIGLCKVMTVLDQPEKIGPGITVAFISILYSALGIMFFGVINSFYSIRSKSNERQSLRLIMLLFAAIFMLLFALFVVLFSLKG